jgi:hypothetical protein
MIYDLKIISRRIIEVLKFLKLENKSKNKYKKKIIFKKD